MSDNTKPSRGWIIDVDGCLVRAAKYGGDGGKVISGALEFLNYLDDHGEAYVVCTNASGKRPGEYAEALRAEGLPIADSHFETAGSMSADLLARRHPGAHVAALGTQDFFDTLRGRGIDVVVGLEAADADAVIVGDGYEFSTSDINAAALAVDSGAAFYCTVGQRWFQGGVGKGITSSALIAAGIAWTTGVQPEVTGKPSYELGVSLATRMGVSPDQVIVVGDAVAEIELARAIGGTSYLVLTGGVDREAAGQLAEDRRPHEIFEDIGAVYAALRS